MSTADDRMARYELVAAAANVEGFRHLAPAGGVDDPSAAYFFQLRCIGCGELTAKDVCLHPPASERIGSRIVAPTPCSYKCKQCGLLGSVELILGTGEPISAGNHILMTLECIGYTPLSFFPGSKWMITTMDGGEIEVQFTGNSFVGTKDAAVTNFSIGVKFFLKGTGDIEMMF